LHLIDKKFAVFVKTLEITAASAAKYTKKEDAFNNDGIFINV